MGRITERLASLKMTGPLARTVASLTPLQRDILYAMLAAEEGASDEALAALHAVTVEDVRRERHSVRDRLADHRRTA